MKRTGAGLAPPSPAPRHAPRFSSRTPRPFRRSRIPRPVPEALVVGAGPTGLVLAIALARLGVRVRIVDKADGPGERSRALVLHARSLEFYRALGFADEAVARGIPLEAARLRRRGADFAELSFREMGAGVSPYPFALVLPQDDHERLLGEELAALGVDVEWRVGLVDVAQDARGVRATLAGRGVEGTEEALAAYLVGCDGARSRVREALGIGFPGGTYSHWFYVADVDLAEPAPPATLLANLEPDGFALMLPVRSTGTMRFVGAVPDELAAREDLAFDDIRDAAERLLRVRVVRVNWFSTYRVHHRVAGRFRDGRIFLAGDAAHIHSPAGGQGMNTGIGDAMNLAWKLAQVLRGRASPEVLDSYEAERVPYAHRLVATTDRLFQRFTDARAGSRLLRGVVAPWVLPPLTRTAAVRRVLFGLFSQIRIRYAGSPLAEGRAGSVAGGDRLPWVPEARNFDALASLDWQAHVYGAARPAYREEAARSGVALHAFPFSPGAAAAGLAGDAGYLVRPDGHVALADPRQDAGRLARFLSRFAIRAPGAGPRAR